MTDYDPPTTAAKIATIETRVGGLEKGIADLGANTAAQFQAMRADTSQALGIMRQEQGAAMAQVTAAIQGLQNTVTERGRAPWGLLLTGSGVAFTILVGIGTLAWAPIQAAQSKIENRVERLSLDLVPRVEHVERWRQFERYQERIERRLDRLDFGKSGDR